MSDLITRLRENADLDEMEYGNPEVVALEREAADEIIRLQDRAKALEKALRPFAALVSRLPESGRDEYRPYIAEIGDATFTISDLRRAGALLEKS